MSKNNSIFLMQYNGYELYRNGNTFEISDDNLYVKNNEVFYQDWIDDPFERAEARGAALLFNEKIDEVLYEDSNN